MRERQMFRMPWNEKQSNLSKEPLKKQYTLKQQIKGFFVGMIISSIVTFIILACREFIKIQDQYYDELEIPYPIKKEYLMDNYLRFVRFTILSESSDGFVANWLQKIHYKLYLKIKAKIPDEDPFWIKFWDSASHVSMQDYNDTMKKEILNNLTLLVKAKSKVADFNDYQRFWFARCILKRIRFNINYYGIAELKNNFRLQALRTVAPMLDDLHTVKFVSNYKPYMHFYKDSFYFANSILANYSYLVEANKTISCDRELNGRILHNLGIYKTFIASDQHKKIFKMDFLKTIEEQYKEALAIYNQAYKEAGCKN